MNSGATSERVYDVLKRRIKSREFRPGDRLEPASLSETLNSSVTPVRDVLHLLAGEGLITTGPSEGFHMLSVDEPALQDLFDWNAQVLLLSLRSTAIGRRPRIGKAQWAAPSPASADLADFAAAIFDAAGALSTNLEHARAIRKNNDRLHSARLTEPEIIGGAHEELVALHSALDRGAFAELRTLIVAYHRRRRRAASDIVRALHRTIV